jgi:hypothetical protein
MSSKSKLWQAKVKALKVEARQWSKIHRASTRKLLKLHTKIWDLENKIEHELAKAK